MSTNIKKDVLSFAKPPIYFKKYTKDSFAQMLSTPSYPK
jgi:hypothetical protein